MLLNELTELAELLGLEWQSGRDNVAVICPYSKWTHGKGRMQHPPGSMSWHVKQGESEYNCHACGQSGLSLGVMILQLDDLGYFDGLDEMRRNALDLVITGEKRVPNRIESEYDKVRVRPELLRLILPPPSYVRTYPPVALNRFLKLLMPVAGGTAEIPPTSSKLDVKPCLDYLRNERRLADDTIMEWDIRADSYANRVVFPVRWHTGPLVGLLGRLWREPKTPEERTHHTYWRFPKGVVLFGEHKLRREPVVVVEGPFDVVKVWQAGFNVVGTTGTKFTDIQADKLAEWGQPVVIFYDHDKAGIKYALRLHGYLTKRGIFARIIYPEHGRDAGGYSTAELQALLTPVIDRLRAVGMVSRSVEAPLSGYWGMGNAEKDAE